MFGWSVAIDSDNLYPTPGDKTQQPYSGLILVVGAPYHTHIDLADPANDYSTTPNHGSVYVYSINTPNPPVLLYEGLPDKGSLFPVQAGMNLGWSAAVEDWPVSGAPYYDNGPNSGAEDGLVCVFPRPQLYSGGTNAVQIVTLTKPAAPLVGGLADELGYLCDERVLPHCVGSHSQHLGRQHRVLPVHVSGQRLGLWVRCQLDQRGSDPVGTVMRLGS